MVPAHQHLDPPALFTVRLHYRLEIRHELSRVQCALHLKGRGRRTFLDDMPDKTGDHTEKQQQAEQWRIFTAHVPPHFACGETGLHTEGITRRGQTVFCDGELGWVANVKTTVGGQPVRSYLQQQQFLSPDQAQEITQVVSVQRAHGAPFAVADSIDQ
ncbi:hypothetical protein D3C84_714780 [compost metagenome]